MSPPNVPMRAVKTAHDTTLSARRGTRRFRRSERVPRKGAGEGDDEHGGGESDAEVSVGSAFVVGYPEGEVEGKDGSGEDGVGEVVEGP